MTPTCVPGAEVTGSFFGISLNIKQCISGPDKVARPKGVGFGIWLHFQAMFGG